MSSSNVDVTATATATAEPVSPVVNTGGEIADSVSPSQIKSLIASSNEGGKKSSILLSIKLEGENNFSRWFKALKLLAEEEGLKVNPDDYVAIGDCPLYLSDGPRAQRMVYENCSAEIQESLNNLDDANFMLDDIYSRYSGKNAVRKYQGIKNLTNFKFTDKTVQANFNRLKNILADTITASGSKEIALEELAIHMFLFALPSRFDTIVSMIENKDELPPIDKLISQLRNEELRLAKRQGGDDPNLVNFVGDAGESAKRCQHGFPKTKCWTCDPSKRPDKVKCHDCKQLGHRTMNSAKCSKYARGAAGAVIPAMESSEDDAFLEPNTLTKYQKGEDLRYTLKGKGKMLMISKDKGKSNDTFVLDSGCTQSILKNKDWIINYRDYDAHFTAANNGSLRCIGIGDLKVNDQLTIKNVLYCPTVAFNLVSVSQICNQGLTIETTKQHMFVKQERKIILSAILRNGLYLFKPTGIPPNNRALLSKHMSTAKETQMQVFHRRMGHLNFKSLRLLSHISEGIAVERHEHVDTCEVCQITKAHKQTYLPSNSLASKIGELVHADVCYIGVEELTGENTMFLILTDDASRYHVLYLLKHKDECADRIIAYDRQLHNKTGRHIGTLRSDGGSGTGGEFFNNRLKDYFQRLEQNSSHPMLTLHNKMVEPNGSIELF